MRMSQLFGQTLREAPADAETASHQLLLRAGFIRQLMSGVFSYLPLAKRSMNKIEKIIREEIEAIGGQEVLMPVVHPAEIWKQTGRWHQFNKNLGKFVDCNGRELVMAMSNEEVVAELANREIHSYRQLPKLIFQIQTQWRDNPKSRAGLFQSRESIVLGSYSLDQDWEGLDCQYNNHLNAYRRIFQRCALPVIAVQSDTGIVRAGSSQEFIYLTPIGEDSLVICDHCGFSANRQSAKFRKESSTDQPAGLMEKIATPECKTIAELADFLGVKKSQTAKAVFLVASIAEDEEVVERFVFVVVRGDMEVNETKLARLIKARDLRPATEDEIKAVGAVPGYASPVGLKGVWVVVDEAILISPNLVSGANEAGYHYLNVNYGRDFHADLVADIVLAQVGDECPQCGAPLRLDRGSSISHLQKFGSGYSELMDCYYLDETGKTHPIVMGSYGIGIGKLMACVAEAHHDDYGLIWPPVIAPFNVHLVLLKGKGAPEAEAQAEQLYEYLKAEGLEVLFDDRAESPGVKFNDADLIGIPVRLTVSERALKSGGVEFKRRDLSDREILPLEGLASRVKIELDQCQAAYEASVKSLMDADFSAGIKDFI